MEGLDMETIRFNVWDLRPDRREAVQEWVRSLGFNLDDIAAQAAIVAGRSGWELHLSRYVRNEQGTMRLDIARNDVVTEPVVTALGSTRTWPDLGLETDSKQTTVRVQVPTEDIGRAVQEALAKAIKTVRGGF